MSRIFSAVCVRVAGSGVGSQLSGVPALPTLGRSARAAAARSCAARPGRGNIVRHWAAAALAAVSAPEKECVK